MFLNFKQNFRDALNFKALNLRLKITQNRSLKLNEVFNIIYTRSCLIVPITM